MAVLCARDNCFLHFIVLLGVWVSAFTLHVLVFRFVIGLRRCLSRTALSLHTISRGHTLTCDMVFVEALL